MRYRIKYLVLVLASLPCAVWGQMQVLQYWFDGNYTNKVELPLSGQTVQIPELDANALSEGLHTVHVRAKDNNSWSVVHTQLFCKIPKNEGLGVAKYEYWIDNDYQNRRSGTLSGQTATIDGLTTDPCEEGIHVMHIRVFDNKDRKSVVHSQMFYKVAENTGENQVNLYEYWIDNHFENRITTPAQAKSFVIDGSFDMSELSPGVHTINIRAKDRSNRWSDVHTRSFYVNSFLSESNKITAYRYWFDSDFDASERIALDSPLNPYELKEKRVLSDNFSQGEEHTFHIQFQDLAGNWSTVASNTFKVVPLFTEEEFEALKTFYLSTGGDNWLNTKNNDAIWDFSSMESVNDWKGISLKEGCVNAISLTANNLAGVIPADIIERLPNLKILQVDSNRIEGLTADIPANIDLTIRAQHFMQGEIAASSDKSLTIPIYAISRYKHSTGGFTENNQFDFQINSGTKRRVSSSGGNVTIQQSALNGIKDGDTIRLVQYNGDAAGTLYQYTVNNKTTSLNTQNHAGITIYPTLVKDGFFVSGLEWDGELEITDFGGRIVYSQEVTNGEYIPTNGLSRGIYIISLKIAGHTVKTKIVKI